MRRNRTPDEIRLTQEIEKLKDEINHNNRKIKAIVVVVVTLLVVCVLVMLK